MHKGQGSRHQAFVLACVHNAVLEQDRLGQSRQRCVGVGRLGWCKGVSGLRVVLYLIHAVGCYVLGQVGRGQGARDSRVVSW